MKVIILAAGRSKRLKPVDDKNFLDFLGKPLIKHQIEQLMKIGLKDFIVVGGKHNLKNLFSITKNIRIPLKVIEQKNLDAGMAGAVFALEKLVKNDDILIVSAQDIIESKGYETVLLAALNKKFESFIVGKKVISYFPGGYLKINKEGLLKGIIEKPGEGNEPSKIVNLVIHYYRHSGMLYKALREVKSGRNDHYETALDLLIQKGIKIKVVPYSGFWQAIKYPWHILAAMDYFLRNIERIFPHGRIGEKPAEVAKSAVIRGKNVYFESGVRILDNAVIVGPAYIGENTIIGTNTMVRESHIGNNCMIGFGTEIARSYIGNNVWTHNNYIGDSVIGDSGAFGSGTVTGNLRLDQANISANIQDEKINTGLKKFGIVTGNNVRCGINTSFMPGVKIGNNCFIGAGIIVANDIEDNKYVYGKSELIIKENKAILEPKNR